MVPKPLEKPLIHYHYFEVSPLHPICLDFQGHVALSLSHYIVESITEITFLSQQ